MPRELLGEIISTGSELMLGRLVDTNTAWLSEALTSSGVKVVRHTSVGDDLPRIIEAFKRAWDDHHVIIATGGLGPTEDDLTRQAASEAFGLELVYDEHLAEDLKDHFARRGYIFTDNNKRQAWLPKGANLVPNSLGTAPGFALADQDRLMVFLPGVPAEMKQMIREWILPGLRGKFPVEKSFFKTVVLKTAGLGESLVDSLVGDLMKSANPAVGLLAAPDVVRVLVSAKGDSDDEIDMIMAPVLTELKKRLDGHIFGYGETTLQEAAARLLKQLDMSLTLLDGVTQGRLSGALAPAVDPNNFSSAQELSWHPSLSGVKEILHLYAPDSAALTDLPAHPARRNSREVRLIVAARPDNEAPRPGPDETALVVECAVQCEALNKGLPITNTFRLGGGRNRALTRAASLATFHLWQTLKRKSEGEY